METVNFSENFDESHPAFGTKNGWYLFAFTVDSSIRRLVVVEAKNKWAIMTMETILLKDGFVSGNCHIVSIFRDCDNVGLRSSAIDEISYADFMIDVVDSSLLLSNVIIPTFFRKSLSDEERSYISSKLSFMASKRMDEDIEQAFKNDAPRDVKTEISEPEKTYRSPSLEKETNAEKLYIALTSLGFNKKVVRKYVSELGNTEVESISVLVKRALTVLNA